MARRPSPEVLLALVLATVMLALAARQVLAPKAETGGLEGAFRSADLGGLGCLKRAVEGPSARHAEDPFEPTQADVERLADVIERTRELEFEAVPTPEFVTSAQMARIAGSEGFDQEDLLRDEIVLRAFGAIERAADLELLSSGEPAGFYEPSSGDVVVVSDLGSLAHTTAHELTHALSDQALGIPEPSGTPRDYDEEDLALAGLVEGDATFTSSLVSPASAFENIAMLIAVRLAAAPEAPHLVVREGMFPYVEGLVFVCHLWSRGGWQAVDAAYERPPLTTDQILFPERYTMGERSEDPRDPERPEGWTAPATEPWGAASLLFLFEAPGGELSNALEDPRERVRAWAGGEVHVLLNDDDHAVVLTLVQRPRARSLCDSVEEWYRAAYPEDEEAEPVRGERMALRGARQDASLRCAGREVRLALAPDLRLARSLSV